MALGLASQIGLWSFLALVPFIILYLIRPKPKEMTLPSLMFLLKLKGSTAKTSFLKNILKDLLFLLQLLALCLLALSVADPFTEVSKLVSTTNVALVIDTSASM